MPILSVKLSVCYSFQYTLNHTKILGVCQSLLLYPTFISGASYPHFTIKSRGRFLDFLMRDYLISLWLKTIFKTMATSVAMTIPLFKNIATVVGSA